MKKVMTTFVLLAFLTTAMGCTGSFNLTKKVYDFHRSQDDKWMDEISFLVVAILPVYGIATFADAVIFNSIEFWTDENPIAYNPDMSTKMVKKGDQTLLISYDQKTDEVLITPEQAEPLTFEKTDAMVLAKDSSGDVLFTSMKNDAGDVTVYRKDGSTVKEFSALEIQAIKDSFAQ